MMLNLILSAPHNEKCLHNPHCTVDIFAPQSIYVMPNEKTLMVCCDWS